MQTKQDKNTLLRDLRKNISGNGHLADFLKNLSIGLAVATPAWIALFLEKAVTEYSNSATYAILCISGAVVLLVGAIINYNGSFEYCAIAADLEQDLADVQSTSDGGN